MAKPPDAGSIIALHQHLKQVWAPCHTLWRETDTFIHLSFQVWDNKSSARNRPSIHPALATSILNHAIDSQLSFTPRFHRPYMGTSEKKKETSDRVIEP